MDAFTSFEAPKLDVILNCRLGGEHLGVTISTYLSRVTFFGKVGDYQGRFGILLMGIVYLS